MRREMGAMLELAWPVILAEIGWILMGLVDTVLVAPLGPAAIGAVGTGSSIFLAFMVFGIGTLFALDTYVSQAFGAGDTDECRAWLVAGVWLAVVMSVVLVAIGVMGVSSLARAGMHPDVAVLLQPYLQALLWSAPPLLIFTVLRRYLQAMSIVRPIMAAVVFANIFNAVGNWVFVYGHWGMPALGTLGSAYATLLARLSMMAVLVVVVFRHEARAPGRLSRGSLRPDVARMWRVVRLGGPAAMQIALEVGVFATAAALAARISPIALAANQIVLNIASFFFMVPYGLGSAAAVRVGQAIGRGDRPAARRAGWSALALSLLFTSSVAALFLAWPTGLLRIFSDDPSVLAVGATLLMVCAVFQPFDGFQVVATGALRGAGDTRTPMICNLAGHWLIGLPVAYTLCFNRAWGVIGLWSGLSLGLILIGMALTVAWHRRTGHVTWA